MTKDDAEKLIQHHLAQFMETLNAEVIPLAREHKIEFSFLGLTYHLYPPRHRDTYEVWDKETEEYKTVPRPPAKEGLLVSDEEWCSSTFYCGGRYGNWHMLCWPENEDED